ncbi:MAG TPA: RNA polymerase sigma factor [Pirellulales bacterium]|nr:RNA polymerase sigma factor [Pirellulales bacterium]
MFHLSDAAAMNDLDVGQIAELYLPRLHRAALILTGNPWDADDLTQEAFLILSREMSRFGRRSSIYTWLYGILLNLDRNRRRRGALRRNKLRVLWNSESNVEKSAPPAETSLEASEWKRSLWSLVADLPTAQRHALALRFSAQLPYDEIAEVLGCPVGTVKSRIFHGVASLREKMLAENRSGTAVRQPQQKDVHHAI